MLCKRYVTRNSLALCERYCLSASHSRMLSCFTFKVRGGGLVLTGRCVCVCVYIVIGNTKRQRPRKQTVQAVEDKPGLRGQVDGVLQSEALILIGGVTASSGWGHCIVWSAEWKKKGQALPIVWLQSRFWSSKRIYQSAEWRERWESRNDKSGIMNRSKTRKRPAAKCLWGMKVRMHPDLYRRQPLYLMSCPGSWLPSLSTGHGKHMQKHIPTRLQYKNINIMMSKWMMDIFM